MKRHLLTLSLLLSLVFGFLSSGIGNPVLVGYWHNWNDGNAPYIPLDQVDSRYTVVNLAFAAPEPGSDYKIAFVPDQVSPAILKQQIQALQTQGRRVNISIGGANGPIILHNAAERDTFAVRLINLFAYYGFDGLDIDLEGNSLTVSGGTLYTPVDAPVINLIAAAKLVMQNYRILYNKKMFLSMAPETAGVQGGKAAYAGVWGAYLPVIHGLRDSLDILHVQLYNSGSMIALDNNSYSQGTADFIVAMTEMVIQGFSCSGGTFFGIPAAKVAVGLPACSSAAGGGYTDTATVAAAIRYLKGTGPKPGIYTRIQPGGYPNLKGMMTWSINWDASASCSTPYTFATNYQHLFMTTTGMDDRPNYMGFVPFPNPFTECINLPATPVTESKQAWELMDARGCLIRTFPSDDIPTTVAIPDLPEGLYILRKGSISYRLMRVQSSNR